MHLLLKMRKLFGLLHLLTGFLSHCLQDSDQEFLCKVFVPTLARERSVRRGSLRCPLCGTMDESRQLLAESSRCFHDRRDEFHPFALAHLPILFDLVCGHTFDGNTRACWSPLHVGGQKIDTREVNSHPLTNSTLVVDVFNVQALHSLAWV